ncbi:Methionine ABC transporter ATP-binding protein [Actinokineospora spheciospongiae]|uniref:Methionine ABC transporter ATP-binding protein n=1 Tax=Actinokineospora spheciospongiae TaxID=909613 RepID=W7J6D9_9PSEU|nr:ABC transporter ATP-binding protein [Actinokineospora spheciospongiae]EWC64566.1 Methionine ABC transporter ATP-binding protein [Actinokineospora spheciospongiae]
MEHRNVLRVVDLHKSFRGHEVLRGVEFDLAPGELFGIIGENGAGKSPLLRVLAGELPADRGDALYAGRLGYCPQKIVLNDELTPDQHLALFRRAYGLRSLEHANQLVERLGYERHRSVKAGLLSGGTRQKLNLTIALMHDPDVVLMDEPYQGFDWDNYLNFWSIAEELRDRGRSVLIISHLAHDTARFDRLHKLREGRLTTEEAVDPPAVGAPALERTAIEQATADGEPAVGKPSTQKGTRTATAKATGATRRPEPPAARTVGAVRKTVGRAAATARKVTGA